MYGVKYSLIVLRGVEQDRISDLTSLLVKSYEKGSIKDGYLFLKAVLLTLSGPRFF